MFMNDKVSDEVNGVSDEMNGNFHGKVCDLMNGRVCGKTND